MFIVMHNLYGIDDGSKAYYRKRGTGCFDFVGRKDFASELTKEEAADVMREHEWYCKQYGASHMTAEP